MTIAGAIDLLRADTEAGRAATFTHTIRGVLSSPNYELIGKSEYEKSGSSVRKANNSAFFLRRMRSSRHKKMVTTLSRSRPRRCRPYAALWTTGSISSS